MKRPVEQEGRTGGQRDKALCAEDERLHFRCSRTAGGSLGTTQAQGFDVLKTPVTQKPALPVSPPPVISPHVPR